MTQDSNSLKELKNLVGGETTDSSAKETPNRQNIFLKFLRHETGCKGPDGNEVQLPLIEQVALAMISKATNGNVSAATFVLDNAFGKIKDIPEEVETPKLSIDWSKYTEEDINQLNALITKGIPD